jgi:hypothetical protein
LRAEFAADPAIDDRTAEVRASGNAFDRTAVEPSVFLADV